MEKTVYDLFEEFVQSIAEDKPYIDLVTKIPHKPVNYWRTGLDEIDKCFVKNPIGSVSIGNKAIKKNQIPTRPDIIALKLANDLGVKEIDFFQKLDKQFEKSSDFSKEAFSNLLWLWHLPINDMKPKTKTKNSAHFFLNKAKEFKDKFPQGLVNYGFLRQSIYSDLKYLSKLFNEIINSRKPRDKTSECYKKAIKEYCEKHHDRSANIRNLLLYFCDVVRYEPIAASNTKERIAKNLSLFFLKNKWDGKNVDETLQRIVNVIIKQENKDFEKYRPCFISGERFFSEEIRKLWKSDMDNKGKERSNNLNETKNLQKLLDETSAQIPKILKTTNSEREALAALIALLSMHLNLLKTIAEDTRHPDFEENFRMIRGKIFEVVRMMTEKG